VSGDYNQYILTLKLLTVFFLGLLILSTVKLLILSSKHFIMLTLQLLFSLILKQRCAKTGKNGLKLNYIIYYVTTFTVAYFNGTMAQRGGQATKEIISRQDFWNNCVFSIRRKTGKVGAYCGCLA